MSTPSKPNQNLEALLDRGVDIFESVPAGYVNAIEACIFPTPWLAIHLGKMVAEPGKARSQVARIAALRRGVPALETPNAQGVHEGYDAGGTRISIVSPQEYYPQAASFLASKHEGPGYDAHLITRGSTFVGRLPFILHAAMITAPPPHSMKQLNPESDQHAFVDAIAGVTSRQELFRFVGMLPTADCSVEDVTYIPAHEDNPPGVFLVGQDNIGGCRFGITISDCSPEGLAERPYNHPKKVVVICLS